jgi:hypothetical protein
MSALGGSVPKRRKIREKDNGDEKTECFER